MDQLQNKFGDLQDRLAALQGRNGQPRAGGAPAAPADKPTPAPPAPRPEAAGKENGGGAPACSGADGGGAPPAEPLFAFGPSAAATRLGQAAIDAFREPEFLRTCEEGLNQQLTRTKDGATAQSRIAELASAWGGGG